MIFDQLLGGLTIGAIYAVVALGFVMVIRALDLINFAQGEMMMAGAFLGLGLHVGLGLPFTVAFLGALAGTAGLGALLERFAYRPLHRGPLINLLIATVAMSILLRNLGMLAGGAEPLAFPSVFGERPFTLGGLRLVPQNLAIIGVAGLLVLLLQLFFQRTRTGLGLRAVMRDREMASLLGVNVRRAVSQTFALSGALGAAGGILIAPLVFVSFDMGTLGLKAFTAATLGGLYSFPGAIVGGLLLGLIETLVAGAISSAYRDAIVFGLLILLLLVRPAGLLGRT